MADRNEVKALLARAGVEINNALKNVDKLSESELEDLAKDIPVAFFDKNGSCAAPTKTDLVAFFDKNGSCSSLDVAIERALRRR